MRTTQTRTVNWRRPIPREDPALAELLEVCTALALEVTILRERLDAHERLAARTGVFSPQEVDEYEPDAAADAARDQVRQGQIKRIFRALKTAADREADALEAGRRAHPADAPGSDR